MGQNEAVVPTNVARKIDANQAEEARLFAVPEVDFINKCTVATYSVRFNFELILTVYEKMC